MKALPSIVVVTSPTRYESLLARWGTKGQAKFRLRQSIQHKSLAVEKPLADNKSLSTAAATKPRAVPSTHDETRQEMDQSSNRADQELEFDLFEKEFHEYQAALQQLRLQLDLGYPLTFIERKYLPTYEFRNAVAVVVVGPDGLVANTAKYVGELPIIGVNPDPSRIDGVLLRFSVSQTRQVLMKVLKQSANIRRVTMAEAILNDGQSLLAFNDLFIGRRTHVSSRYNLSWRNMQESQSSSGVIVATGAGSTGWLSSIFNMTNGISHLLGGNKVAPKKMHWETRSLAWVVREPFISRYSQATLIAGTLDVGECLCLDSLMPEGGVIFSDGVETDFLDFNSGASVRIQVAKQQARIVTR